MDKVSILVPVFNEEKTIINVLETLQRHRFLKINLEKEIIILLDTRSNDGTKTKIENFLKKKS